eukprot:8672202-Prorocentrum_lima.AAC.1
MTPILIPRITLIASPLPFFAVHHRTGGVCLTSETQQQQQQQQQQQASGKGENVIAPQGGETSRRITAQTETV